MENGSKCSIFQNILKNLTFQRCPKALVWSKGLNVNLGQARCLIPSINLLLPNIVCAKPPANLKALVRLCRYVMQDLFCWFML